jgi:FKBP-type peptidyl-prolyl cis-trans isomerase 2
VSELVAKVGDTVSVHYVGSFPGERIFDTSVKTEAMRAGIFNPARDYRPIQVKIGEHRVIPGFEEALVGMRVNETKEVVLPPEKAYGRKGSHPMAGKTLCFKLTITKIESLK